MLNHIRLLLLQIIAILGVLVSLYLYLTHLSSSTFCPLGDCAAVNNSKYAQIGGIPMSVLGFFYYMCLFAVSMFSGRKLFSLLMKAMLLFGLLFSIYLTYLEIFVINAICFWCVISFILILTGNAIVFWTKKKDGKRSFFHV
ncbi:MULTISPECIES: vitamin K epoxide reductase family protein [Bacillus]|uniref:vitamin K epoxide reductase family protein n=1 Tax=Bacillus TaxID=1386 RepID=UPI0006848196|nr:MULTISPECIES: vitamin K epoxide reductase family protein [Bacillus]QHZ48141.1 vitamin K epoxide reductase family protein [Bacillus sp. NSP9.1]